MANFTSNARVWIQESWVVWVSCRLALYVPCGQLRHTRCEERHLLVTCLLVICCAFM